MKRQQVISRFFTPKAAASPTTASANATVPKQSSSGLGILPLASRAPASSSSHGPVNGSEALSQDFASDSSRKGSSRKRLQDEVEDNARDDSLVEDSQQEIPFSSGWYPHALLCYRETSLNGRPSLVR